MHPRRVIGLALGFLALIVASPAHAWQEAHQFAQEARVRIDPNGQASVDETLRWRIAHGPLKAIDLAIPEAATVLDSNVTVSVEDGHAIAAHLAREDERTVRVFVDEPRAAMHGTLTFAVHWRVDLLASSALARDGATWRLTWSAPPASDGIDGARTLVDVAATANPPQPIVAETGVVDDGAVSTLRREGDRDVLELVRPHVARGEAATWTVRIDARALATHVPSAIATPTFAPLAPEPDRVPETSIAVGLLALALAFGVIVSTKSRAFAAACAARGVRSRALVSLPDGARAVLAGASLAAGVGLQFFEQSTAGGALVALAALAATLRAPATKPVARGPGRWLALRPSDAFASSAATHAKDESAAAAWLDLASRRGRVTGLLGGCALALLAEIAGRWTPAGAWLVAMDGAALLPLLVTGSASQLPPRGGGASAPWLSRLFRRLRGVATLRVAPWARLALDGAIDEVRILVLPRAAMPGLVGVEVGLGFCTTPVGWAPVPELLVRVLEGTSAAAQLARLTAELAPRGGTVVGRRPDERVVRMTPRIPTVATAAALAKALAEQLTDRRLAVGAGVRAGLERRIPKSDHRGVTKTASERAGIAAPVAAAEA